MVYLHLKIGNNSYDPLELDDEFLSHRWVWANTISEPMLSLSYDFDILSLGLLTYQVRSMDVHLQDQPSGCLANLDSTCQDKAVGRVLLNETEHSTYGERPQDAGVVCVAVIEKKDFYSEFFEGNVRYHCCAKNKNKESSIQCDLVVKSSGWFEAFNGILNILTLVMILYCLAFLPALPNFIINLREEYSFYFSVHLLIIFCCVLIWQNLTVACFAGALSFRLIAKMFGYIIIGLVLNAGAFASPFGIFVIAVSLLLQLAKEALRS